MQPGGLIAVSRGKIYWARGVYYGEEDVVDHLMEALKPNFPAAQTLVIVWI